MNTEASIKAPRHFGGIEIEIESSRFPEADRKEFAGYFGDHRIFFVTEKKHTWEGLLGLCQIKKQLK